MRTDQRHATVLLADIAGFTAISERLDPERVTEIMNRCFEALEGIVIAHDGEVAQYLGDCIVALFGNAGPSDGSREAIEAALEIRACVATLGREMTLPSPLGVHIGLDTGPVQVCEVGGEKRRETTVTGTAARAAITLEDESRVGEILVGSAVRAANESEYEFREHSILDFADSQIRAFELLGPYQRLRRVKRSSERRQATVMFLEIAGVDRLPPSYGPSERQSLLDRCFTALERRMNTHGGVIDKYIGNSVLVLFGVPDAIEDAPLHAVHAAVEARRAIGEIASDTGTSLSVRAGINTGLVIAGEVGGRIKHSYTVLGDAVNVAARLKEAADDGAVWVGPSTHRATQDAFEYDELRPMVLKGKSEPMAAWAVVSESTPVRRMRERRTGVFSTLVGRDQEVAELKCHMKDLANGRGGVVTIVGDAGIGKSRLIAELLRTDACKPLRVLEGRSNAAAQTVSFHPFVNLFRHWAGIDDDTNTDDAQVRLRDAIASATSGNEAEVFPFIATLMGMPLSGTAAARMRGLEGDALERFLFKTVRELLAALAERQPLLLIFDDLHWADQSSLRLLDTLLRAFVDISVLFVLLCRPDYEQTSERLLARIESDETLRHSNIRLYALSTTDAEALIHALIPIDDLPQKSRRLIVNKAEGNPYYLEEVMRSLVDLGAIEETARGFRVTERIEEVEIPDTVQELILARVDRLDESTRHVLQLGAVIGRSFYYSLMRELLRREGTLDERLDAELSLLRGKQLLQERGTGWTVALGDRGIIQEVEYLFQHGLAQEAIYESLLQRTRTDLHATVATTIETLFAHRISDFYPMLAYHYSQANELTKAESYLFKAGEKAAGSAASSEALQFFREAARLYMRIHGDGGDPEKKAQLEKHIGSALLTSGQLSESVEHYDRALEHLGLNLGRSRSTFALRLLADASAVLSHLYLRSGANARKKASPRQLEIFDIMFRRFKALTTSDPKRLFVDNMGLIRRMNRLDPETVHQACLAYCLGCAAFAYSGASFAVSRRFLDRATVLLDRTDVTEVVGYEFTRFTLNFLSGNWSTEPGIDDAVLDSGIRQGVFWDVNSYLGLECDRRLRTGRFDEAERCLERLEELGGTYGYEFAVANHDGMHASLLLEQRRLDEALGAVGHYLEGRHEPSLRVLALGMRAKARLLHNDSGKAAEDLYDAAAIVRGSSIIPPWHLSAYTTAELRMLAWHLKNGKGRRQCTSETRRAIRRAIRVASRVAGAQPETYRLMAHIAWLRGHENRSTRWWDRAISTATRLGARPELARALGESASCSNNARSPQLRERAADHVERYREMHPNVEVSVAAIS